LITLLEGERGLKWDEIPLAVKVERLKLSIQSLSAIIIRLTEEIHELRQAIQTMQEVRRKWEGRAK